MAMKRHDSGLREARSRAGACALAATACALLVAGPTRAETSFVLDFAVAIPNGMRLCDAETAPVYCLDITLDPASTEAANFQTGSSPLIYNVFPEEGVSGSELVILTYDTSNSPTPFNLDAINILDIESLTANGSDSGVRDAYAWSKPGSWSLNGPVYGAVVSIDRSAADDVGSFVIEDVDGNNDLADIGQFTQVPDAQSDVLLNMSGDQDGHDVTFRFATRGPTAKLYAFNSGGNNMLWSYVPTTQITLGAPTLTLGTVVDNSAGGSAVSDDFILSYTDGGASSGSGVAGSPAVTGTTLPAGTYTIDVTGPAGYSTTLDCTGSFDTDMSDGLTISDGEDVVCTLTNSFDARRIGGLVFLDTGAGGGTAHDGIQNGGEGPSDAARVTVHDGAGAVLGQPGIGADGRWELLVAGDYAGDLSVVLTPGAGHLAVSEAGAALPGLVNADPHDGTLRFAAAAETSYDGIDFGLVPVPRLSEDRTASVQAGAALVLGHVYKAESAGQVAFSLAGVDGNPAAAFSVTLFSDAACDGAPDTPLLAPVTVAAGDRVCLVSRVVVSAGAGPGSALRYDLQAQTRFEGTPLTSTDVDTDRVTVAAAKGALELSKTVRNLTRGTAEGAVNAGAAGEVLEYRIYLENPGAESALDVIVHDATPPFTALAEPVASPVAVGPELSCSLAVPLANLAGYAGPLRWDCAGLFHPGEAGALGFRVRIAP